MVKYLLDTNTLSELYKPRPDPSLLKWMRGSDLSSAYISTILLGELRRGVENKRKHFPEAAMRYEQLLDEVEVNYSRRVWNFDVEAAHIWGKLSAKFPNHPIDTQIAAITMAHDALLVTRNVKDFKELGIKLINPFDIE